MNIVVDVSAILVETLTITIAAEEAVPWQQRSMKGPQRRRFRPNRSRRPRPRKPPRNLRSRRLRLKAVVKQKAGAPKPAAKQTSEARSEAGKGRQRVEVRKDPTKPILERMKATSKIMKSASKPKEAASSTRKVVVKELRANSDFNDIDGLVKAAKVGATCHLILGIDADRVDGITGPRSRWHRRLAVQTSEKN